MQHTRIMEHILVLSVIILHHVDSYSCRVAKQLQQPLDTDITDYTQLKQRDRDITSILQQLLERSPKINNEQKNLAKLTIEPYNKNINKTERDDPVHWFDKKKKTIAPLAIIVTNLPEITKLQNIHKNIDKESVQDKDNITPLDTKDLKESPKEELLESDLHTNVKSDFTDFEPSNNQMLDKGDDFKVNFEDLDDFSIELIPNNSNKSKNSPYIDLGWQSKEVFDNLKLNDVTNVNTEFHKSVEIDNSQEFKSFNIESDDISKDELEDRNVYLDLPEDKSVDMNEQVDVTMNVDQENLINLLVDDTDLKIITDDKNEITTKPLFYDSKISLKITNNEDGLVHSAMEANNNNDVKHHKCKRLHDSGNTYNLSFLFNR